MTTLNGLSLPTLPIPDADALAHSAACATMLRDTIREAGGWISFAEFMGKALYAPGLGYYAAGARKFGRVGDFVTAPEISPLFGQCVARSVADTLMATHGSLLELGPGTGKLAFDVLLALDALNALPEQYLLLEVSADLQARQRETLSALPPLLFARCVWMTALPVDFVGAMVANEVLDVVPVHLVTFNQGRVFERGVGLENNQFCWQDGPAWQSAGRDLVEMVAVVDREVFQSMPPERYVTEFVPQAKALTASLVHALKVGVILLIDYGFRRSEFYHTDRTMGTLMCHYRHHAHTDPFLHPGLQDITAHVDFTAIAEAGVDAGGELIGYATQANFLLGAGIIELIAQHDPNDTVRYLALTNQAQRLLSPAEMGEFFKVIGFCKGPHTIGALANMRQLPL